ncbi:MAG: sigma-70 family RNA polymerase sigma factor [Burkholderiaceae bacterium]
MQIPSTAESPEPPMPLDPVLDTVIGDDPREFGERVARVERRLFGFLARMGLDDGSVAELAQETLLRAWLARHRYDPRRARFVTWLLTIARRQAIDSLRRHVHPLGQRDPDADIDLLAASDDLQPDARLIEKRRRQALMDALHRLPESDRSVIALAYVDGLSTAAAAAVLDCTAGAFRTRLTRARARLAQALASMEES